MVKKQDEIEEVKKMEIDEGQNEIINEELRQNLFEATEHKRKIDRIRHIDLIYTKIKREFELLRKNN